MSTNELGLVLNMATSPMETRTKLSGKAAPFIPSFCLPSTSAPTSPTGSNYSQSDKGEFKLGDFRSRLLMRAQMQSVETQTSDSEYSSSQVDAAVNFENAWSGEQAKGAPQTSTSEKSWFEMDATTLTEGMPSQQESTRTSDLLPVKHTFIHFSDEGPQDSGFQWSSAPAAMMHSEHRTKYPAMEAAHIRGECCPCFYNTKKADGCRFGEDCEFCHLCPPGSLRKKRKEKMKARKEQETSDKRSKGAPWWVTSTQQCEKQQKKSMCPCHKALATPKRAPGSSLVADKRPSGSDKEAVQSSVLA